MTAALEPVDVGATFVPATLGGLPYLSDFSRLAEAIADTEMVPDTLRGRPAAVLSVMLAGYELGVGPMQALQSVNIIKGKPSVSPELMRALVARAGHQVLVDASDVSATVQCHRREWDPDTWSAFTWTIEDAKRAGLVRADGPWVKFPRAMLTARATSEACRAVFPDVIAGLSYTPEEVSEFDLVVVPPTPPARAIAPGVVDARTEDHGGTTGQSVVDTAPSPPPAKAAAPKVPDKITDAQMRTLHDVLRTIEITEPIDVHLVVGRYVGRTIESLTELTAVEARTALDYAKAAARGNATGGK